MNSVRRMHPHWDYRLWTDDDLPPMRNRDAFERSTSWCQKADVLRYEVLRTFGGVYVDADSLALKPLDALLSGATMFAAYERGTSGLIANGVIGCVPGHPVMERLIRELDIDAAGPAWESVGPGYFTRIIERDRSEVRIFPGHYFYPVHYSDPLRLYFSWPRLDPRLRDSYLFQYWGSTTPQYEPFVLRWKRRVGYELRRRGWL